MGARGKKHTKIQEVTAAGEEGLTASTFHREPDRSNKLVEATHNHQLLEKHGGQTATGSSTHRSRQKAP